MKYVDTSAFVKYYADESAEKGAKEIACLLDSAKDTKEKLMSSVLLIGECASVFDKWLRQKKIDQPERDKLLGDFINDIKELTENGSLELESVNTLTVIFSVDYIVKHHLTVNDALHLYAALSHKSKINKFVCSDNNLIRAAEREGLAVMNPEEDKE